MQTKTGREWRHGAAQHSRQPPPSLIPPTLCLCRKRGEFERRGAGEDPPLLLNRNETSSTIPYYLAGAAMTRRQLVAKQFLRFVLQPQIFLLSPSRSGQRRINLATIDYSMLRSHSEKKLESRKHSLHGLLMWVTFGV